MKTIQCAHPPHYHNGFVATCRLWTASGRVYALYIYIYIYIYIIQELVRKVDDNENSVFKNDRFLMSFQVFKS